jgi:hypothetical protein
LVRVSDDLRDPVIEQSWWGAGAFLGAWDNIATELQYSLTQQCCINRLSAPFFILIARSENAGHGPLAR